METQNLWPDFAIDKTKSPKTILKEQAGYLMARTNNVLSAAVETSHYKENISHEFYVVAPALNNYRYRLFSVSHEVVGYYPVTIMTEVELQGEHEDDIKIVYNPAKAKNEEEFMLLLSKVFKNPENVRIISSLLSQSLAE